MPASAIRGVELARMAADNLLLHDLHSPSMAVGLLRGLFRS